MELNYVCSYSTKLDVGGHPQVADFSTISRHFPEAIVDISKAKEEINEESSKGLCFMCNKNSWLICRLSAKPR